MSIAAMTFVWEHSRLRGTELNLLLAIADFANQDGIAWPGIPTLAKRIRADQRTAQRCLKRIERAGELRIERGAGPSGTHLYHVVMATQLQLGARAANLLSGGGDLPPGTLPARQPGARGGGVAVPPEPTKNHHLKKKEPAGRANEPTPVSLAFQAYKDGIKAKYGADYPPSARTNGMLSQLVARVGAANAVPVIQFYLGSGNPFYGKVKHALKYLVTDCERLLLDLQSASGGAPVPPKHAEVYLLKADGEVARRLQDTPVGEPLEIAKAARKGYSMMIAKMFTTPKYLEVRLGAERSRFSIEELPA